MADKVDDGWKRPADIMKGLRVKRKTIKKPTQSRVIKNVEKQKSESPSQAPDEGIGRKRRNPFGCDQASKRVMRASAEIQDDDDAKIKNGSSLLLNVLEKKTGKETERIQIDNIGDENLFKRNVPPEQEHSSQLEILNPPIAEEESGELIFPADWSLRTKARFISDTSFAWCAGLKSREESSGLLSHMQGAQEKITEPIQEPSTLCQSECHRHCMYWIHPNIPGTKMFPRLTSDTKVGKPSPLMQTEELQKEYFKEWADSFSSVFNQLRNGLCPYFYLCTHQLNVLFRASGVGGMSDVHAMVGPTSRGFREALKKDGIEFQLPLSNQGKENEDSADQIENESKSVASQDATNTKEQNDKKDAAEDEEEDQEIAQTDEGASDWLQSMGLDADKFKSLDPTKVKLSREGFRAIDQRPESLVLVEGPDTQALYNYFLNSRSSIAIMGSQAGVPPTILSPVAFKGAILKTIKTRSCQLRQEGKKPKFCLELTGPLLPHSLHGIQRLMAFTQGPYTATYSIHEPSTTFNAPCSTLNSQQAEVTENTQLDDEDLAKLKESGILSSHATNIIKENKLGKSAVRQLTFQNNLFTWIS